MSIVSRNPVEFLRRHGLVNESTSPAPRLDLSALLVNSIPMTKPYPAQSVLKSFEGDPSPDRSASRPWPDQPE